MKRFELNDFASRQSTDNRTLGVLAVIVFHAVLVWMIQSGLAIKAIQVIQSPVVATLIDRVSPDLSPKTAPKNTPKDVAVPVPPTLQNAPPPALAPPVDVPAAKAAATVNAIANVTTSPASPTPAQAVATSSQGANVRVGPVVHAASNCPKPPYPPASTRQNEEGTVILKILIGADGKVMESRVEKSSGFRRLDEATLSAMAKCQFKPGTVDGKPVADWGTLRYKWELGED